MDAVKYAISNAKSYNKFLTRDFLMELPYQGILCFTHPLDREDIAKDMVKQGYLEKEELEDLQKFWANKQKRKQ